MKTTLIILLLVAGGFVKAQDTIMLSLPEAVQYSLNNHANVKNARLDEQIAKAAVGEVLSTGLPQIEGSMQVTEHTQLQRMFLEYQPNSPFFPPGTAEPGEVVSVENLFQLPSSGDANLSFNQLIFSASYFVGLKAAKVYRNLSALSEDQTEIDRVEAVTKAYYLVMINRERLELYSANLARLDSVLRETRELYDAGFAEQLDVNRLVVNYNNLETDYQNLQNLYAVSKLMLKFQMGMPLEQEIVVTGGLENITIEAEMLPPDQTPYDQRTEFKMAQVQKELSELDLKNYQMEYLPTISGFGTLGANSQYTDIWGVFDNTWYQYSMIGVNMSISIFDGLGRRYRIKQAKLEVEKAENDLAFMEESLQLQISQTRIQLINALDVLESRQENMELAEEVASVTRIKYNEGVGSNLEVVTAETSYKEAQTAYFNALYEALLAKVDYQRAIGNLYQPE